MPDRTWLTLDAEEPSAHSVPPARCAQLAGVAQAVAVMPINGAVHRAEGCHRAGVRVVASGGCAAAPAVVDAEVPAVDPEDACQRAIDAGLTVQEVRVTCR